MIKVSAIIVVRNEENYIIDCIKSLEMQFDNNDQWELIIVDGLSEDNTKQIIIGYLKNKKISYLILDNSEKKLVNGWNIGIKNSRGKYLIRPDAHAILHKNYINSGINILNDKENVGAVGGLLITKSKTWIGQVIKEALSSKVGVGNSSFRTGAKSGYQDTVVYAVYRKEVFDQVGLFNENLIMNQDIEFHYRVRKAGWKFWLNEHMGADYFCRDNVPDLLGQMYRIGYYLPDLIKTKMTASIQARHIAPMIFYTLIALLFSFSFFYNLFYIAALIILLVYFSIIVFASFYKIYTRNFNLSLILLIPIIPMMHMVYGIGTFIGLLKFIIGK